MAVLIWLQFLGKKHEINSFIVFELQIFSCHDVENPVDCTQIVYPDCGVMGENKHVYFRKSTC